MDTGQTESEKEKGRERQRETGREKGPTKPCDIQMFNDKKKDAAGNELKLIRPGIPDTQNRRFSFAPINLLIKQTP